MTALGADTVRVGDAPLVGDTRYGGSRRDWAQVTWTDLPGCAVQPISGEETAAGREFTATRVRLYAPGDGAGISAHSRVEYDGTTYEVDGEPARWRDGADRHVEAVLKRLEG